MLHHFKIAYKYKEVELRACMSHTESMITSFGVSYTLHLEVGFGRYAYRGPYKKTLTPRHLWDLKTSNYASTFLADATIFAGKYDIATAYHVFEQRDNFLNFLPKQIR